MHAWEGRERIWSTAGADEFGPHGLGRASLNGSLVLGNGTDFWGSNQTLGGCDCVAHAWTCAEAVGELLSHRCTRDDLLFGCADPGLFPAYVDGEEGTWCPVEGGCAGARVGPSGVAWDRCDPRALPIVRPGDTIVFHVPADHLTDAQSAGMASDVSVRRSIFVEEHNGTLSRVADCHNISTC